MVPIFVVLTFIIFLVVDYFVLRAQKREHPAFATMQVFDKHSIFFPVAYLLSRGHVWLKAMKDGAYRLGIDEFVVKAFKKVVINTVAAEGMKVKRGDVIMQGTAGTHTISFRSPVDGIILQTNKNIPGKTILDPYNDDWGLTIQVDENSLQSSVLKTKEKAKEWMNVEFKRLKDFLTIQTAVPELAGVTMADGGNIVEGALTTLSPQIVETFEKDFLNQ